MLISIMLLLVTSVPAQWPDECGEAAAPRSSRTLFGPAQSSARSLFFGRTDDAPAGQRLRSRRRADASPDCAPGRRLFVAPRGSGELFPPGAIARLRARGSAPATPPAPPVPSVPRGSSGYAPQAPSSGCCCCCERVPAPAPDGSIGALVPAWPRTFRRGGVSGAPPAPRVPTAMPAPGQHRAVPMPAPAPMPDPRPDPRPNPDPRPMPDPRPVAVPMIVSALMPQPPVAAVQPSWWPVQDAPRAGRAAPARGARPARAPEDAPPRDAEALRKELEIMRLVLDRKVFDRDGAGAYGAGSGAVLANLFPDRAHSEALYIAGEGALFLLRTRDPVANVGHAGVEVAPEPSLWDEAVARVEGHPPQMRRQVASGSHTVYDARKIEQLKRSIFDALVVFGEHASTLSPEDSITVVVRGSMPTAVIAADGSSVGLYREARDAYGELVPDERGMANPFGSRTGSVGGGGAAGADQRFGQGHGGPAGDTDDRPFGTSTGAGAGSGPGDGARSDAGFGSAGQSASDPGADAAFGVGSGGAGGAFFGGRRAGGVAASDPLLAYVGASGRGSDRSTVLTLRVSLADAQAVARGLLPQEVLIETAIVSQY